MKLKKGLRHHRKGSRASLKRKADKLFGMKIRERGKCELSGFDQVKCSGQLQTMHIVGRSNHNLRWDITNALCGCSGHHRYYTSNPFAFFELVRLHFPDRYEYVNQYRNELWDGDLESVVTGLEDTLDDLQI